MACGHHGDGAEPAGQEIIGGADTRGAYVSAALINTPIDDFQQFLCSGSLIAPRVVLTAGHCVTERGRGFQVTLPYANNQRLRSSLPGVVFDYVPTKDGLVINELHDVGLIILDTPATLREWPILARSPVGKDAKLIKVGRIDNGKASQTALFASRPASVALGELYGLPYSYTSSADLQQGDSGGPNFIEGATPPTIAAVNSGTNGSIDALARVDILATWIDERVAEHGGYASSANGSSADGGDDGRAPDAGPIHDGGVDVDADIGEAPSTPTSPPDSPNEIADASVPDAARMREPQRRSAIGADDSESEEELPSETVAVSDGTEDPQGPSKPKAPSKTTNKKKIAEAGCSASAAPPSAASSATSLLALGLGLIVVRRRRPSVR